MGRRQGTRGKTAAKDANLVGWWKFDGRGTVETDASGAGNNAQIINATRVNGKSGGAVDIASGDYVLVADDASLDISGDMSITFWVNADTITANDPLIRKSGAYLIRFKAGGDIQLFLYGREDPNANNYHDFDVNVSSGVWEHVGVVVNSSDVYVYKNGSQEDTTTFSGSTTITAGVLDMGRGAGNDFTDGKLDDTRIYSRALTAAEIKSIYDDLA